MRWFRYSDSDDLISACATQVAGIRVKDGRSDGFAHGGGHLQEPPPVIVIDLPRAGDELGLCSLHEGLENL
jgi:hypothetical protein